VLRKVPGQQGVPEGLLPGLIDAPETSAGDFSDASIAVSSLIGSFAAKEEIAGIMPTIRTGTTT